MNPIHTRRTRRAFLSALTAGALAAAVAACGGNGGDDRISSDSIGSTGPAGDDAWQQIVEAAKAEGEVTIYSSNAADALAELGRRFEADYGIRLNVVRDVDANLHQKIGAACLRVGRREQAEEWFAEALDLFERRVEAGSDDPHTKYYIACLHALRGQTDRALRMLEESSRSLGALNRFRAPLDPDLESLHGEARFREALGASEATA